MTKSLISRVDEESKIYSNHHEAALDHLSMAHAQLFEEYEGRDVDYILSNIKSLISQIEAQLDNN